MNKTCIIIAGPTAVGKTSVAIELAKYFSTEIISADSRQCYRELNIAVAKPTPSELAAIPHHFIDSHSIHENVSAADFETYALDAIEMIFQKHDLAVLVGGTGLYIRAFAEGMDDIPAIDATTRERVIAQYDQEGIGWLRDQLAANDPLYASRGEMENPQRMMRALEVFLSTGKSILDFQSGIKKQRAFNILKTGLELPRPALYDRVNQRVDQMFASGLVEEARSLLPYKNLNALQTVGYRELFEHFEGKHSLARARELIKQNTRHYAKRQLTWFKRDSGIHWMPPHGKTLIEYVEGFLKG